MAFEFSVQNETFMSLLYPNNKHKAQGTFRKRNGKIVGIGRWKGML